MSVQPDSSPLIATQADIARSTGVSLMTVQRALAGHRHVAEPTRRLIQKAAQQLGYRPNAAARSTRTGRTGCVSLLLSTLGTRSITSGYTLHGIQEALRQHDLHLLVEAMPDARLTDEGFVPKILRQLMCDGLLINYNAQIPDAMIELLRQPSLPSVWLNSKQAADCVYPDDLQAGRRITAELLALGHHRIVFVDFTHSLIEKPWHYSGYDRFDGYAQTMRDAGLTPRRFGSREQFERGLSLDAAIACLQRDDRPTAVVAYVAREARIMFTAARISGLRVPEDLSIAVFESRVERDLGPPLTTMRVPETKVGLRGAQMLIEKLQGGSVSATPLPVPFTFEPGQTCASHVG